MDEKLANRKAVQTGLDLLKPRKSTNQASDDEEKAMQKLAKSLMAESRMIDEEED